jgi:hypothetical protein
MRFPSNSRIALALAASLALFAGAIPAIAANSNGQNVPDGPYLSSCTDVHRSGFYLMASCTAKDGSVKANKFKADLCIGPIENHDGKLWCATRMN